MQQLKTVVAALAVFILIISVNVDAGENEPDVSGVALLRKAVTKETEALVKILRNDAEDARNTALKVEKIMKESGIFDLLSLIDAHKGLIEGVDETKMFEIAAKLIEVGKKRGIKDKKMEEVLEVGKAGQVQAKRALDALEKHPVVISARALIFQRDLLKQVANKFDKAADDLEKALKELDSSRGKKQ